MAPSNRLRVKISGKDLKGNVNMSRVMISPRLSGGREGCDEPVAEGEVWLPR